MVSIIGMTKEKLISLDPQSINRLLSKEEIIYIATVLGAFWQYDYQAAQKGQVGMHALLKSGLHSDGFFVSRILFQYPNILTLIAQQMVLRFNQLEIPKPDWVAGIPDGATRLGEEIAKIMDVKNAKMKKVEGRILLESLIGPNETLLIVEDFCTRGTGFIEAVKDILSKQPETKLLPFELVIINRGGLKEIVVEGVGSFQIVPVVEHRINDWRSEECPLCQMGSIAIKPKETDENWKRLTTSQKTI